MKVSLDDLKCINENINLDEYINFIKDVKNTMEYPDWLAQFSKDELQYFLNNGSRIWIYYYNEEPVCSMFFIPADKRDALEKFDLDFNYIEVADYGTMLVNPKYLGNKLQYQMLKVLDNYVRSKNYKYVITTIHPNNSYSINNFVNDGFELIKQRKFKRGYRNIYFKKI